MANGRIAVICFSMAIVTLLLCMGCTSRSVEETLVDCLFFQTEDLQIYDLELLFGASSITDFAFIDSTHLVLTASDGSEHKASIIDLVYTSGIRPLTIPEGLSAVESQALCLATDLEEQDLAGLFLHRDRRTSPRGGAMLTVTGGGLHAAWRDTRSPTRRVIFEASLLQLTILDVAFVHEELLVCTYRRSVPMLRDSFIPVHLIELVGLARFDAWTYSRPVRELHIGSLIDDFHLDFQEVEELYLQAFAPRARGYALIHLDERGEQLDYSLHHFAEYQRILPLGDDAVLLLPDATVLQTGGESRDSLPLAYLDSAGIPQEIFIPFPVYSGSTSPTGERFVCFALSETVDISGSLELSSWNRDSGVLSYRRVALPDEIKIPSALEDRVRGDIWDSGARLSPQGDLLALLGTIGGRQCLIVVK